MGMIRISDIAKRAGVSIATVSRVLNAKHVRPANREKVTFAMRELNYGQNGGIKALGSVNIRNLAMLVPDLSVDFYSRIVNSAVLRAHATGRNLLVSSCDGEQSLERTMLEQLATTQIDALLYCPVSSVESFPDIQIFQHMPVVCFARRDVIPDRPHVYSDNRKGGYISTKYLQRLGRRRIAMLLGFWNPEKKFSGPEQIISCLGTPVSGAFSSLDRLEGHRRALEEEGFPLMPELIQSSGYDFDSGYEGAKALMARMIPVDAIIAPNDSVAAGVIRFLSEQHIEVPEEISVVGYDDSSIAQMTTPTLTTIRQDPRLIGSTAVDLAMDLIQGRAVEDVIVDVTLSIRKSTCGV